MRCGPGSCDAEDLPAGAVGGARAARRRRGSGAWSTDVVDADARRRTDRDPDERRRCSARRSSCGASCSRRSTRTTLATAEFKKATGILGGLWEKVRERPDEFLDRRTIEEEGLDAAARDFLAGMTDRYAVRLFEQLFIPKPWVEPGRATTGPRSARL